MSLTSIQAEHVTKVYPEGRAKWPATWKRLLEW